MMAKQFKTIDLIDENADKRDSIFAKLLIEDLKKAINKEVYNLLEKRYIKGITIQQLANEYHLSREWVRHKINKELNKIKDKITKPKIMI